MTYALAITVVICLFQSDLMMQENGTLLVVDVAVSCTADATRSDARALRREIRRSVSCHFEPFRLDMSGLREQYLKVVGRQGEERGPLSDNSCILGWQGREMQIL